MHAMPEPQATNTLRGTAELVYHQNRLLNRPDASKALPWPPEGVLVVDECGEMVQLRQSISALNLSSFFPVMN